MTRYLVVPQWQGSPSSRAMQLIDGAQAIAGDLPRSATTTLEVPMEAGEALDTGIHRLSALQRIRDLIEIADALQRAEAMDAGSQALSRLHRHLEDGGGGSGEVPGDRLSAVDELHRPG